MEVQLQWWNSLDAYWKRYFKIRLKPELDANREERDRYIPDAKDLQTIFDFQHLEIRNVSVSMLKPLTALSLTSLHLNSLHSLKNIQGIEKLNLTSFEMRDCFVTDLTPLESIATLRELQLELAALHSSKSIGKLKSLAYLFINAPELKEVECFNELSGLEELTCVKLAADLSPISKLTGLKTLRIKNCQFSSLALIGPLPFLILLDLTKVTMESLAGIDQFPELTELILNQCTTVDLKLVEKLSKLKILNVGNTLLEDLTILDRCASLQEIFIHEDNFTRAQILAFKCHHPHCNVYSERGRNFPFMKYLEYTVIKEKDELKQGMTFKFIDYTYNHYDGEDIYYLQAEPDTIKFHVGDWENFLWKDYVIAK